MKNRSSMLRIGLVQMLCEKADIDGNLRQISGYIDEAESKNIDILALPEASITGYVDRGGFPGAVISPDGPEIDAVRRQTTGRNVTVLTGFIETNPGGKPFVTQAVIRNGRLIGCFRKMTIAEEDVGWFTPGDKVPAFTHDDLKFGIAICSDIDSEDIFAEYARQEARIVFECAAPGLYGEQATRDWRSGYEWWEGVCMKHLPGYAREYGIWIAVSTQTGRTVDEDFPGGGYVFAPNGERVYATRDWQPGAVYLEIDLIEHKIKEL